LFYYCLSIITSYFYEYVQYALLSCVTIAFDLFRCKAASVYKLTYLLTCWKLNHTSLSYPWTSPKLFILYVIRSTALDSRHFCINWLNFTFLIKSTTGWWTSLITIPTALYSATNCHHCLALPPVSSRSQPSDQPPMSSLLQIRRLHVHHQFIIPANNEATRHMELANVQKWAERNNLKLNCSKSTDRGHLQRTQAKATPCCCRY